MMKKPEKKDTRWDDSKITEGYNLAYDDWEKYHNQIMALILENLKRLDVKIDEIAQAISKRIGGK